MEEIIMRSANHLLSSQKRGETSHQGKIVKIILAILAVIIIIFALILYFTSGLTGSAREQLAALKSENIEAAYHMTSSEFQKMTTLAHFKRYVEQYPILKNYKSVSFTDRKIEGSLGYISGTIENADGSQMKIEYQLVKEDNQWKIQALRLTPMEKKE